LLCDEETDSGIVRQTDRLTLRSTRRPRPPAIGLLGTVYLSIARSSILGHITHTATDIFHHEFRLCAFDDSVFKLGGVTGELDPKCAVIDGVYTLH
jgi:hypothetical protein